jgi:hypothetical protein
MSSLAHRRPPITSFSVGALCLALTGLVGLLVTHERGTSGDEPFYLAMAAAPRDPHNFPYAYRVAVPWLVHLMPFRAIVSFTILGLLAVAVSAGALFALLRDFDVGERVAAGLSVGFTLSPVLWVVIIRHFISIDPASVMVMILGVLFIVRRQRLALLITLTIGAAVRESTMFLVPFTYLVWAERPLDRDALRDTALTCVLPVIVYGLIRTQIDAVDKQYIPGYSGAFLTARVDLVKAAPWGSELRRLAYTYGPLWLVAPFALRSSSFARRGLLIVFFCLVSMTYAYDWDRVMFLAAPVFFVGAGIVLAHRRRLAILVVVALLSVDVGYGIYLQAAGVSHGIDASKGYVPVVR